MFLERSFGENFRKIEEKETKIKTKPSKNEAFLRGNQSSHYKVNCTTK